MSKQGFIYKYTYPNGKVYIGQTRSSVKQRHYEHMSASKDESRRTICEIAIAKYGEPKLDILETFEVEDQEQTKLIDKLNKAEKKWIKEYDSTNRRKGYNIQCGGEVITPEQYILEEKWYEIFDKEGWGEILGYYSELLKLIGYKICISNEKLTKEEMSCWYGYKFMDYTIGKETTFKDFYNRNEYNMFLCDIGDVDPEVIEILYSETSNETEKAAAEAQKSLCYFNSIMKSAIEDHWIKDIQKTIWKKIMKKKDKIIKEWLNYQ